jgi:hypothetical protein
VINKLNTFLTKLRKYAFIRLSSALDYLLFVLNIADTQYQPDQAASDKTVVYLGEYSWPRISRIAKYVQKDFGYRVVLVCSKMGFTPKLNPDCFDQVITFRNAWHLKRILMTIRGVKLIHAYGPVNSYPAIGITHAQVPAIYDAQDVLCCYYGLNPHYAHVKTDMESERINFTASAGLVAQSPEPIVGRRIYGTPKSSQSIFFPIYCDPEAFVPPAKMNKRSDGIHVVYIGGVAGSHRDPQRYGSIQFHWLIDLFSKQQIHFHIYPSPTNIRADYIEYEQTAKENPYFHFHNSISQSELSAELSQYHFSILPFFSGQNKQSNSKYKYATAFKLFNYIEAGLPVIVSKDVLFQSWLINRYGCGLSIEKNDLDNLASFVKQTDYNKLLENLIAGREKLSLRKQIPRMVRFYDQIAAGGKN